MQQLIEIQLVNKMPQSIKESISEIHNMNR